MTVITVTTVVFSEQIPLSELANYSHHCCCLLQGKVEREES